MTAEVEAQREAVRLHAEVVAEGRHLIDQMGMRDVECSAERYVIEMDPLPETSNVRGAIQGGIVMTLIDVAAGKLVLELIDGLNAATADMNVHFLAPVIVGPARAEARAIKQGRRTIVTQTEVWDVGRDRLAAVATVTFAVLEPR